MTVHFRKSFVKDLDALNQPDRARIEKMILDLEAADTLREIRHLKKLQGRSGFFRIRAGDYRVGLIFVSGVLTLVRCLDRKEFYRCFP
jgi:mRNA interferase RelE/StbE